MYEVIRTHDVIIYSIEKSLSSIRLGGGVMVVYNEIKYNRKRVM